jgi:hypothetical protein
LLVKAASIRLKHHAAIGMKAAQGQLLQDMVGCAVNAARPIDIFNAN